MLDCIDVKANPVDCGTPFAELGIALNDNDMDVSHGAVFPESF